jgi:hypothetical protein
MLAEICWQKYVGIVGMRRPASKKAEEIALLSWYLRYAKTKTKCGGNMGE